MIVEPSKEELAELNNMAAEFAVPEGIGKRTKPGDPAYWMLFDGFETAPIVYSKTCYICNDPEFAQMGLPLCRKCPACGGHVQADDTVCDDCGLDDYSFWMFVKAEENPELLSECFSTGYPDFDKKVPTADELDKAIKAYHKAVSEKGGDARSTLPDALRNSLAS